MKSVIETFDCGSCGTHVQPLSSGTRNHCPQCLWSKHVDDEMPGDRKSECLGRMQPIAIDIRNGMLAILHECEHCGKQRWNKVVRDDSPQTITNVMVGQNERALVHYPRNKAH